MLFLIQFKLFLLMQWPSKRINQPLKKKKSAHLLARGKQFSFWLLLCFQTIHLTLILDFSNLVNWFLQPDVKDTRHTSHVICLPASHNIRSVYVCCVSKVLVLITLSTQNSGASSKNFKWHRLTVRKRCMTPAPFFRLPTANSRILALSSIIRHLDHDTIFPTDI